MESRQRDVLGVGIDIAVAPRFERLMATNADRVWAHWFTPAERRECALAPDRGRASAARFAMKEAVYKAVGVAFSGELRWRDIEVLRHGTHWRVRLHGEVARAARAGGVGEVSVTTSWVGDTVLAMSMALGATKSADHGCRVEAAGPAVQAESTRRQPPLATHTSRGDGP